MDPTGNPPDSSSSPSSVSMSLSSSSSLYFSVSTFVPVSWYPTQMTFLSNAHQVPLQVAVTLISGVLKKSQLWAIKREVLRSIRSGGL